MISPLGRLIRCEHCKFKWASAHDIHFLIQHMCSRSAYEQFIFCDVFHSKESGWRECTLCGKVSQYSRFSVTFILFSCLLVQHFQFKFNNFWYVQRLHCGCVASRFLLELLDGGGVKCINCVKNSGRRAVRSIYMIIYDTEFHVT